MENYYCFTYGYLVVSGLFAEKIILSPLNCYCTFENCPCICRPTSRLYSVPLIYLPMFMSVQHCIDYCNFINRLEAKYH